MPRGKIEASADMWRDRVRRWKESGLSAREFAAREGIERHGALSWWAHQLSRRDAKASSENGRTQEVLRVVQLAPTAEESRTSSVEIVMPSGARLVVSAHSDVGALQRALYALEERS